MALVTIPSAGFWSTIIGFLNAMFVELYSALGPPPVASSQNFIFTLPNTTTASTAITSQNITDSSYHPCYFVLTAASGTTDTVATVEAATNVGLTNWVRLGQAFFTAPGSAQFLVKLQYFGFRVAVNRINGGTISATFNRGIFSGRTGWVITKPQNTGVPCNDQAIRTAAFDGDSRTVHGLTIDSTGTYFMSRGFIGPAISASCCDVPIVAHSASVGRKLGPMFDALATDIYPYNPTDLWSLGFVNSIEDWPVSTDAEVRAAVAGLFAGCKLIYDDVIRNGIKLHILSETANSSLTTNQKKVIPPVVALQQRYAAERPEVCDYVEQYRTSVDPTSSVGNLLTTMTTDQIHYSGLLAFLSGSLIAPSIASRFPKILPAMSQTDSRWVNAGSNQLLKNPLMTGTAGTITTAGISGQMPTDFSIGVLGSGGSGFATDTTLVSIIPASDGNGFAIRLELHTSGVRRFTIKGANMASMLAAGKGMYFHGKIKNSVLGSMKLYTPNFIYDGAGKIATSGHDDGHSVSALPVFDFRGFTTPRVFPSGASTIEPRLYIETLAQADNTSVIIIEGLTIREF